MHWQERTFIAVAALVAAGTIGFIVATHPFSSGGSQQAAVTNAVVAQDAPIVSYLDPALGADKPSKTVVLYANYACPYCKAVEDSLRTLAAAHPEIRLVWKDLPESSGPTELAAEAAQCAKSQGKFWEYHDALLASDGDWSDTSLSLIANNVGLDTTAFSSCLTNGDMKPFVAHTVQEGIALNITATPTIFIGKTRYVGQLSYDQLQAAIR